MSFDFHAVVKAAHRHNQAERREKEAAKEVKTLRGGDAGAVIDGKMYGKCSRLAGLRYEGVDVPVDHPLNTLNQFEGGFANEDIIYEKLVKGGIDPAAILREEEIPVAWTTKAGLPVSGRPDICIMEGGKVKVLFELKSVVSLWTAKSVHYDLRPKSDNLIQAAHYSMAHDAEETLLVYSSYSQFHLSTAPKWLQAKFQPGTHDVDFKADGTPMKILAFDRVYRLTWGDDDVLSYWTEGLDAPQRTKLTKQSIRDYYEQLALELQEQTLGPRPSGLAVDGGKSFKACDYCALKPVCDQYEKEPRQVWKDHVLVEVDQLEQKVKEALDGD